jgi:CRISPR-associated protein Cmr4
MANYKQQRFLLMTLDPVHIGTGGYRLGRVDLSIVREPGTNVPKIPGTGFSGASRSYAAYLYGKPDCAGKGGKAGEKHCGEPTCPICYTFGYARGERGGHSGTVSLFDAHILLFPVHSMAGPVWVSTVGRLRDARFKDVEAAPTDEEAYFTMKDWDKPLNLGWLMLKVKPGAKVKLPPELEQDEKQRTAWEAIKGRIVLVTEKLFSQIVNSNLEVRTSVSINPATGAAEEGALFTYEAIPRATWLVTDVVEDDYRNAFPSPELLKRWLGEENPSLTDEERERLQEAGWTDKKAREALKRYTDAGLNWASPIAVVKEGLKMTETLGVGGMGTRGFGRMRLIGDWEVKP